MTQYSLGDSWLEVCEGSASVKMIEGLNVWLSATDSAPSDDNYWLLTIKNPTWVYSGESKLYAKRAPNSTGMRTRIEVVSAQSYSSVELGVDESFSFPSDSTGEAFFQTSDNSEWCYLTWGSTGNLELVQKSANVGLDNVAETIQVEFSDGAVNVYNRMSSARTINYKYTSK